MAYRYRRGAVSPVRGPLFRAPLIMSPEFPFIASGVLLVVGGVARNKGFPKDTVKSLAGTAVLALIASATTSTRIEPVVRAIGLLYLLTVGMATIKILNDSLNKDKKK